MTETKLFIDKRLIYTAEIETRTGERKLLEGYALSTNGMKRLQKLVSKIQQHTDDLSKVADELTEVMSLIFGGAPADYGDITIPTISEIMVDFFNTLNKKAENTEEKPENPT